MGNNLYDFYNRALAEGEERAFEEHLLLCFHCQEKIQTLDLIFKALEEGDAYFQPLAEEVRAGLSPEPVETN